MRALWLIDGSYIYKAMREFQRRTPEFAGRNIDYMRLKKKLMLDYGVDQMDSWYFSSVPEATTDAQSAFHSWMKTAEPQGPNIRVKLYRLKYKTYTCRECGSRIQVKEQKGVDVGIATFALRLYERYDTLILSAGDGDFEDFIRFLVEEKDKCIYIAGFGWSISRDIQQYCSGIYLLNDIYADIADARLMPPYGGVEDLEE